MPRGLLARQFLSAAVIRCRPRPTSAVRRVAFVSAKTPRRAPIRVWTPLATFSSVSNPSVFLACGRTASSTKETSNEHIMSLPIGEGADALVAQSCADLGACSRDTPKLNPEQITSNMLAVPVWTLSDDSKSISRKFTAKNWQCAFDFLNKLSEIAEHEGHHPDVSLTKYRDVQVIITTHAIGGLSLHDFVLAAKLDAIDVVYSPKWLRENAAE